MALGGVMTILALFDFGLIIFTQMAVETFWECPCDPKKPFWKGVLEHIIFPVRLNHQEPHGT